MVNMDVALSIDFAGTCLQNAHMGITILYNKYFTKYLYLHVNGTSNIVHSLIKTKRQNRTEPPQSML